MIQVAMLAGLAYASSIGGDELLLQLDTAPGEEVGAACVVSNSSSKEGFSLRRAESGQSADVVVQEDGQIVLPASHTRAQLSTNIALKRLDDAARERRGADCSSASVSWCAPELPVPDERLLWLVCAENTLHETDTVAVVQLRTRTAPAIEGLHLSGRQLRIDFTKNLDVPSEAEIEWVGGDYVSTLPPSTTGATRLVPMARRCRRHALWLPGVSAPLASETTTAAHGASDGAAFGASLTFSHGGPDATCEAPIRAPGSPLSVYLPYGLQQEHTLMRSEIRPTGAASDSAPLAVAEAAWSDGRAPDEIRPHVRSFTFDWQVHPLYPRSDVDTRCPTASVPAAGATCGRGERLLDPDGETSGACRYVCTTPSTGVDLPTRVDFQTAGLEQSWSQRVGFVGQIVRGYVPPRERRLELSFERWVTKPNETLPATVGAATAGDDRDSRPAQDRFETLVSRRQDEITSVEIIGPTGEVHRVIPSLQKPPHVPVPGVRPGDVIAYRILGDRQWRTEPITVDDGRIEVPAPKATAVEAVPGLTLAVGGTGSLFSCDGLVCPLDEDGTHDGLPSAPALLGRGVVTLLPYPKHAWRRSLLPKRYELGVVGRLTTQRYLPVDQVLHFAPSETLAVPFYRVGTSVDAMWPVFQRGLLGAGVEAGLGFPVLYDDIDRVGTARPYAALRGLARARLGPGVACEPSLAVLRAEIPVHWSRDFLAGPSRTTLRTTTFLLDLGLHIELGRRGDG